MENSSEDGASYWRYDDDVHSDDEDLDVNNRITSLNNHDEEDEDEELEMMEVESAVVGGGPSDEDSYQAKCGAHPRPSLRWRLCRDEDQELSESDRKMVRATIGSVHADHIQCNCLNSRCKIVRYLKSHHGGKDTAGVTGVSSPVKESCQIKRNDLNAATTSTTASHRHLQIAKDDFRRVHDELIALAGGKERATKVYQKICDLAKGQTRVDSKSSSNTALMQLCSTMFKDETDPTRTQERMMLNAQIYALAKLYMDLDPEALFVRNTQDAGALELAALTNKVVVAKYLVMLHTIYGRDVNAPNQRGHTLLHLLARKGDDCAETLEALLGLRVVSEDGLVSRPLLRMDVLNEGKKTPLDVATACVDLFSIGKDRTIFTRTIAIFHGAIEDEARRLEESDTLSSLTFQNDF